MPGTAEVKFIFDNADEIKVNQLYAKLTQIDTTLNSLGTTSNFGNNVATQINTANLSLKENINLQIKIAQHEKASELAAKAAIQTERERLKLEQDRLKIAQQTQAVNTSGPTISRGTGVNDKFDFSSEQQAEQKRALGMEAERNQVAQNAAEITRIRQEESKKAFDALNNDDELYLQTSVARKSSLEDAERKLADFKIYQADRAAKAQADDASEQGTGVNTSSPGTIPRLRGFGAIFRAVGSPINESEINAGISLVNAYNEKLAGTAEAQKAAAAATGGATTAVEGEAVAVGALNLAFLVGTGILIAAGVAIVKYSISAKEEAEKYLKTQKEISVEYGNQNAIRQHSFDILQQTLALEDADRKFGRNLQEDSLNNLISQRDSLLAFQHAAPSTRNKVDARGEVVIENKQVVQEDDPEYIARSNQLRQLNARIDAIKEQEQKGLTESYRGIQDVYNQGVDNAIKAAEERQKAFNKAVEEGTKKVEELSKQYTSAIDSLFIKTGSNNPFVKIFDEGNKAIDDLRQKLKGLSPELIAQFETLQRIQTGNQLFSAKLDNKLESFDLRQQAENFRNPQNALANKQNFDSIVNRSVFGSNSAGEIYRKTYGSNLADQAGGFNKLTDAQKQDIYNVGLFTNLANVNPGNSTFDKLNQDSLVTTLARQRVQGGDANLTLQQKLDKQLAIIDSSNPVNPEQRDIADRKILSLAQNIDPTKLTDSERNKIADAADRRAATVEKLQNEANELQKEHNRLQNEANKQTAAWLELAKNGKIDTVKLEIVDNSNGRVNVRETTQPTRKDTENTYNQ